MSKRKFTFDCWDIDYEGDAYVVSKDECREKRAVIGYIVDNDCLNGTDDEEELRINSDAKILDGWCCYQCSYFDGERQCGYIAEIGEEKPSYGRGWFPVWIVRRYDLIIEGMFR